MVVEQAVLEKLRSLPPEKQREVLDFVEFLSRQDRGRVAGDRSSLKGLWSDLGVDVSDEDIADARREMWGRFPGEKAE
ncbi:MAG: DUF2281 domain-containing protein [Planctomycetes bacterium]|nr:DUF2281 domain-containing protein [Planctomycetota bacterium]